MQAPPLPVTAAPLGRAAWRPGRWLGGLHQRVRERTFWVVQVGVALVTAGHWITEAVTVDHGHGGLVGVLVHVPVILYVVPVAYAALRYGFEGGLLTGAWAALLAVPNMVVFHADRFEWVGELLLIGVVVALGAVVALPAERASLQHSRAELATTTAVAASRRLALLSEAAALPVRAGQVKRDLCRVLQHLIEVLGLSAAAVVARPTIVAEATVEVCCGRASRIERVLERVPHARQDPPRLVRLTDDVAAAPLGSGGGVHRTLLVAGPQLAGMARRDVDLLETIAAQIGAAFETARLQHEQQQRWRLYLRQATRAQEDERRRLARELHDVAVHQLLIVDRRVQEAAAHPALSTQLAGPLDEVRQGLATVTEQLRRFSGALRPSVLTHLGLPAALEWLTTELGRRAGVQARVEVEGSVRRLPDDDELTLFRIAEEAMRNAERHAEPSSVVVRLVFDPGAVCVEVADDGVGFTMPASLEDLAQNGRLGLLGMRERAELSGGHLRIDAAPGQGTRVSAEVPDTNRSPREPASPEAGSADEAPTTC